jgi:hypothetical protein
MYWAAVSTSGVLTCMHAAQISLLTGEDCVCGDLSVQRQMVACGND